MTLAIDGIADDIALQGGRQLSLTPWHFIPVDLPENVPTENAVTWIWENLSGRFSVYQKTVGYMTLYKIYFEDESEASAFTMSMPLMAEDDYY